MTRAWLLVPLLWLAAAAAVAEQVQDYDISKSWDKAIVHVPSSFLTTSVDHVRVQAPMPVVIFLHGCAGIGDHERRWAHFLKSEGFIVVMPDSMAIPGRVSNCDVASHTGNLGKVPTRDLRPAEAQYAQVQVMQQAWADRSNIFLMGHSEGGMGAYLTQELGFRGVIISGFTCRSPGGIRAQHDTPVLALNWQSDPWFDRAWQPLSQCSDRPFWRLRTRAREWVLPGRGHATAYEASARDAVRHFLQDHRLLAKP